MKGSLKNIRGKEIKWFPLVIKSVSTWKNNSLIAEIEDSFKNTFPLRKISFHWQDSRKNMQKWFVLARKSVCTTCDEAFVQKYVSCIAKNYLFWQENRRKLFPLKGNVFLLNGFPLISIINYNSRRKALN